jgi:hypothetical protein
MRILLLVGWLGVAVVAVAWHYGPGQSLAQFDRAAAAARTADEAVAAKRYSAAVSGYDNALKLLPPGRPDLARRMRLEKAKAMMLARKLPEARADLEDLVAELQSDSKPDETILADARETLANSQYYMTWLMRLERQPREQWEPEVEAARQTYRLLAEQAAGKGDAAKARQFREDVESSIRLARMDLGELQGLPLPSQ